MICVLAYCSLTLKIYPICHLWGLLIFRKKENFNGQVHYNFGFSPEFNIA